MSSPDIDFRDRESLFRRADSETFDVVVVGGGITGAGIARDAAMRGLKVALLEANDFSSGTSSRSSKMIHGGLRYLAQGHVGLVKEAARERAALRNIAPHLAQRAEFILPYRSIAESAKLHAGLSLFEKLGRVNKAERHQGWSKKQLRHNEPTLDKDKYSGAYVYSECLTDDARLTLANVRSAHEHGACVLSYARVTGFIEEGGKATAIEIQGQLPQEELAAVVKAKYIVNAAGPWVDSILSLESRQHSPRLCLTKGIHLVFKHEKLPINRTVLLQGPDKRPIFAVPRDGFTYLGTTDTFHPTSDYWPDVDNESIDYLLDACFEGLNIQQLGRADVEAAWAGIRPLLSEPGKKPSEVSRKDEFWAGPLGVLSVAGGKLSAYRAMAERIVDSIQKELGYSPEPAPTGKQPLPGGNNVTSSLASHVEFSSLTPDQQSRLVRLYGGEVPRILDDGGDLFAEVLQAVVREGALRLEDYWIRRSARAWFSNEGGLPDLKQAAQAMAKLLDWDQLRTEDEIQCCRSIHFNSLANISPEKEGKQ